MVWFLTLMALAYFPSIDLQKLPCHQRGCFQLLLAHLVSTRKGSLVVHQILHLQVEGRFQNQIPFQRVTVFEIWVLLPQRFWLMAWHCLQSHQVQAPVSVAQKDLHRLQSHLRKMKMKMVLLVYYCCRTHCQRIHHFLVSVLDSRKMVVPSILAMLVQPHFCHLHHLAGSLDLPRPEIPPPSNHGLRFHHL